MDTPTLLGVGLMLFALLSYEEWDKKQIQKRLHNEIRSLKAEVRIFARAMYCDLTATETRDLNDLVHAHATHKKEEFDTLKQRVSKRVMTAFQKWQERDESFGLPFVA